MGDYSSPNSRQMLHNPELGDFISPDHHVGDFSWPIVGALLSPNTHNMWLHMPWVLLGDANKIKEIQEICCIFQRLGDKSAPIFSTSSMTNMRNLQYQFRDIDEKPRFSNSCVLLRRITEYNYASPAQNKIRYLYTFCTQIHSSRAQIFIVRYLSDLATALEVLGLMK